MIGLYHGAHISIHVSVHGGVHNVMNTMMQAEAVLNTQLVVTRQQHHSELVFVRQSTYSPWARAQG